VTVYLVGAGPGDPGLLTVRGRELLGRCDALVYDRLADPRIVALAPASAKRVYAGKAPDRHALSQDQINALLVELAGRHSCVVRLRCRVGRVLSMRTHERATQAAANAGGQVATILPGFRSPPAFGIDRGFRAIPAGAPLAGRL